MNKEYAYIDGKVIIKDENGKQTQVDYYDNLDEVLVQQNLIETMEHKILELEEESENYKKNNKKHYIPIFSPICILITTLWTPFLMYSLGAKEMFSLIVNTAFGTMNEAFLITTVISAFMTPIILWGEFMMYQKHKDSLKKEKGVNSQLEFLKREIITEKEILTKLEKKKTIEKENKEFRIVEIDDKKRLEALRNWLVLYYDLGYDVEKYYRYYQQGKLDFKLGKNYTKEGMEAAAEYLKEKGPILVKKRNNK